MGYDTACAASAAWLRGGWARRIGTAFRRLCAFVSATTVPETDGRAGINQRAEHILNTYGDSVLRYAYTYLHNLDDAEEILQETLIRFLQTAPEFESPRHEKAWLLRVAGNLSKNRLAYARVRAADELREELAAEQREDLTFVWDAVKSLPEQYRTAVHLFYHEGYSTKEIAQILHRAEPTVRSDLHRARAKLKELLGEAYDFA